MVIYQISENTLILQLKQEISQSNLAKITYLNSCISDQLNEFIIELVPSYCSIHITFDLLKISYRKIFELLNKLITKSSFGFSYYTKNNLLQKNEWLDIPTYYGPEVALDLESVANHAMISKEEVVNIHSQTDYLVFAIGFAPGFGYLGILDSRIAMPRKNTPRQKVNYGSVAIASKQTAIYPNDSPGGWQIIGRTYKKMIDYSIEKFTPLSIGLKVKFIPITKQEYLNNGGKLI